VDVRRLLILRTVAHSGSLAAAARELGWTQPAVSQHVRALERETGLPLVVRGSRGVVLTEAGRVLLGHADAVAARLRAAEDELAELAGLRAGTVRLAAFPSASATLVPAALRELARRRPGLAVELVDAEPPEAVELVASGGADAALVFDYDSAGRTVAGRPYLTARPLWADPVRVVLPAGHRHAGRRRLALADLAADRWVSGCPRCRAHLDEVCRDAGFSPDVRHSTDDYVVVQALVAQGLAVALLPALAVAAFRDPGVRVVATPDAGARHLGVVHHAEATGAPALAAVLEAFGRGRAADWEDGADE
jgi:molybdate transport repressor ModE-like protein